MGNDEAEVSQMEYSQIYVNRIRQLCKERGFAINKLAKRAGINQSTLDNIVRGLTKDPRASTLHKVALLVFGLSALISRTFWMLLIKCNLHSI